MVKFFNDFHFRCAFALKELNLKITKRGYITL